MTEETIVSPTETLIPVEIAKPDVATPEAEAKPEPTPEETAKDEADKTLRKMERRINHKHAQAAAAEERTRGAEHRAAQLEARLAQYEAPQGQPQQQEADPRAMAREYVAIERINDKANTVAADGEKRFTDFKAAVVAVADETGPLFDRSGRPTAIGEAILDSDDPAAMLHHLGTNPDLAAELQNLSPAQLGRRLGRIEAAMGVKPPAPKPVSNAPAPVRPISARSASPALADLSMDEYVKQRAAQGAGWAKR